MQHEMDGGRQLGWNRWFWMAVCCVLMIAIVVLIALGYWSSR